MQENCLEVFQVVFELQFGLENIPWSQQPSYLNEDLRTDLVRRPEIYTKGHVLENILIDATVYI